MRVHNRSSNITIASIDQMLSARNAALRNYSAANHDVETLQFHTNSGERMIGKCGYR